MSGRWTIESHDTLPSTMDLARERVRDGAGDGLVIVAAEQTRGRGRRGSRWESPRGGLWFSVVVFPENVAAPELTVAAALAAAAACSDAAGVDVRMKWPNDLYISGAKVGGVIGETEKGAIVLGVGVNADVPEELLPSAEHYGTTSLQLAGRAVEPDVLLESCLTELGGRLDVLEREGMAGLLPEWRERSLELGRAVVVERSGEVTRGTVRDIGTDGSLVLETGCGRVEIAPHGEVNVFLGSSAGVGEDGA